MLNYKRYGNKENKSIILIHGYLSSHEYFKYQIRMLVNHGFCVYGIDMPGHGLNVSTLLPNIKTCAMAMIDTFNSLKLEKFSLLGHSMGGMLALQIATLIPDKIDNLICYGTSANGNLKYRFEPFEESRKRIKNDFKSFKKLAHSKWFLKKNEAKNFELSFNTSHVVTIESALNSLDLMENFNIQQDIFVIRCKVLLIYGDKDGSYGIDDILFLKNNIKNSHLCILPTCGHSPHLEETEVFNQILIDFLNKKND